MENFTTAEDFVAGIESARAKDSAELQHRRREYARANSWDARAERIAAIISETLAADLPPVIVPGITS